MVAGRLANNDGATIQPVGEPRPSPNEQRGHTTGVATDRLAARPLPLRNAQTQLNSQAK
jgi:hypothetical protein